MIITARQNSLKGDEKDFLSMGGLSSSPFLFLGSLDKHAEAI